jgi:hemerythrin superfamily protein
LGVVEAENLAFRQAIRRHLLQIAPIQNDNLSTMQEPAMNAVTNMLVPYATNMIRLDHTHVLATFHQYKTTSRSAVKLGLVNTTCLALEVHAQLEEEIFYPAVRAVSDNDAIRKSVPEHDEMRRLISLLRSMEPGDRRYDDTYMELMRDVLHHVADEETILLPEAERLLHGRLGELGLQMTKRRMELLAPRTGDIVVNIARAMPASSMALMAGAVAAGMLLGSRAMRD